MGVSSISNSKDPSTTLTLTLFTHIISAPARTSVPHVKFVHSLGQVIYNPRSSVVLHLFPRVRSTHGEHLGARGHTGFDPTGGVFKDDALLDRFRDLTSSSQVTRTRQDNLVRSIRGTRGGKTQGVEAQLTAQDKVCPA